MADIQLRLGDDVLVLQGAMGTAFESDGFGACTETCYPFLNLTEPETVEDLHRRYLVAGADCAVTNTFMATSSRLAPFGLVAHTDQINAAGVRIARGVGFQHVLAAVGPCGVEVEPGSGVAALDARDAAGDEARASGEPPVGYAAAREQYAEQVAALASEGPDGLLLETFGDLDDALAATDAARACCDLPVLVCMSFADGPDGREFSLDPALAARALVRAGAAAVGCNCMDVQGTLRAVQLMAAAVEVPLIARPHAGLPTRAPDGTHAWPLGAREFADVASQLVAAGASVVGPCCGSTPACVGAMFAAVGGMRAPRR